MSRKVAFVSIAILFVAGATWAQWDRNTVPPEPDRLGTGPPDAMTPLGTDGYGIQDYAASMTVPRARSAGLAFSSSSSDRRVMYSSSSLKP